MPDNKIDVLELHSCSEMSSSESTYAIVVPGSRPSLMKIRGYIY